MPYDPCAMLQYQVNSILAEMQAVRQSMPKPPIPPAELRWYEDKIWVLNQALLGARAALDRCRDDPPPPATLYVDGSVLRDRTGAAVAVRGVNLPLLDDYRFPGADNLDEVFQTGTNAVRIAWYKTYPDPQRPPFSVSDLDAVLTRCKSAGVIPIVELGDLTGDPDPANLNTTLIPWWTSDAVVEVLSKHADFLIINLANELGAYHMAADEGAALTAFVDAYTTALQSIRAAGLAMPVMIDAPDFGTSLDFFVQAGAQLVAADPGANVLLSVHAYWAVTDDTALIGTALGIGLPLIFGEIANKQDDYDATGTFVGYYDLDGAQANPAPSGFDYQALASMLVDAGVGWLAWSWGPDNCAPRQLSADGTFAGLTPYGEDVVTNPKYGVTFATKATIPT